MVRVEGDVLAERGAVGRGRAAGREWTAPTPDRAERLILVGCLVALEVGWVVGIGALLYWAFA